jgi:hypothetical protein
MNATATKNGKTAKNLVNFILSPLLLGFFANLFIFQFYSIFAYLFISLMISLLIWLIIYFVKISETPKNYD